VRKKPQIGEVTASFPNFKRIVGKHVRELRLSGNLTQDLLAERCGIYRTYLSRIEMGQANPTLLVLVALANCLDVQPFELLVVPQT
jgi:transcriptional regulator with XRE-family HTH domain